MLLVLPEMDAFSPRDLLLVVKGRLRLLAEESQDVQAQSKLHLSETLPQAQGSRDGGKR